MARPLKNYFFCGFPNLLVVLYILDGGEGHDRAEDRVGREQNELGGRGEAVVDLVPQRRIVPKVF